MNKVTLVDGILHASLEVTGPSDGGGTGVWKGKAIARIAGLQQTSRNTGAVFQSEMWAAGIHVSPVLAGSSKQPELAA